MIDTACRQATGKRASLAVRAPSSADMPIVDHEELGDVVGLAGEDVVQTFTTRP